MLGCQVLSNTLYTCFVIFGFFSKVVYSKKDTRQNMHSRSVRLLLEKFEKFTIKNKGLLFNQRNAYCIYVILLIF